MSDVPPDERPLVVTLRLEEAARQRFEAERAAYFPSGRTAVGAHVTMFHALPARLRAGVEAELTRAATTPPCPVAVADVFSLGRDLLQPAGLRVIR